MQRIAVTALGLFLFSLPALSAAPAITSLLEDDASATGYHAFNGDDDFDPNGLVHLSSGAFVFFDTENGGLVEDSLILFDPDAPGGGVARFATLADESALLALDASLEASNPHIGCTGLVCDPITENLYALLVGTATGDHIIARLPNTGAIGSPEYASPELFADATVMGRSNDFGYRLALDSRVASGELLIILDSGNSAEDATTNGLYTRSLSATPESAPNALVATFADLGQGTTPVSVAGTDPIGFRAVACIGAEDYVLHNAHGVSGATDGDWVLWHTSASSASPWADGGDFATGEIALANFPNGDICALLAGAPAAPHMDDLVRIDQSGTLTRVIATEADLLAAQTAPPSDLAVFGQALWVDDDFSVYLFQGNGEETLIAVQDTEVPIELSVFRVD